jgi:hypothetical protein
MKSSCYSLIPFLPFLLSHLGPPSPELDPTLFLLDYFTTTVLYSIYSASTSTVLTKTSYNHFARTSRKTPSSVVQNAWLLVHYLAMDCLCLCCWIVFTEPLPSNVYARHTCKEECTVINYSVSPLRPTILTVPLSRRHGACWNLCRCDVHWKIKLTE